MIDDAHRKKPNMNTAKAVAARKRINSQWTAYSKRYDLLKTKQREEWRLTGIELADTKRKVL